MLKKDSNYRRLKLGGRSWLSQSTYWIGSNHLLVVEISNYVERYRRFYFRDVQAILVQNSPVRLWWNIGHGAFALGAMMILLYVAMESSRDGYQLGDYFALGAWLGAFLLFTTFMLVNTLRGPSCSVHLRTAVQTQKLPGVGRWRKADAFVAALNAPINAAQSLLTGTEIPTAAPPPESPRFIVDDPNAPPRIIS